MLEFFPKPLDRETSPTVFNSTSSLLWLSNRINPFAMDQLNDVGSISKMVIFSGKRRNSEIKNSTWPRIRFVRIRTNSKNLRCDRVTFWNGIKKEISANKNHNHGNDLSTGKLTKKVFFIYSYKFNHKPFNTRQNQVGKK